MPDTGGLNFARTCERLRQADVFTLAKVREDEFKALPVIRDNAVEAGREVGSGTARRARYSAENYPPAQGVAEMLNHLKAHLKLETEP